MVAFAHQEKAEEFSPELWATAVTLDPAIRDAVQDPGAEIGQRRDWGLFHLIGDRPRVAGIPRHQMDLLNLVSRRRPSRRHPAPPRGGPPVRPQD